MTATFTATTTTISFKKLYCYALEPRTNEATAPSSDKTV